MAFVEDTAVGRKQVRGATGHKSCVNDVSTLHNAEAPIMDIVF